MNSEEELTVLPLIEKPKDFLVPQFSLFNSVGYTQGTCLITGGLGGFGLSLAEWLIEKGIAHIALVSIFFSPF